MKFFLSIFAIVAAVGIFTLKGYNAMGCAYVCCMALFCLTALSIRVRGTWRKGIVMIDVNPEKEIAIHDDTVETRT